MGFSPTVQTIRKPDGGRTVSLPEESLLRLGAMREVNGQEAIADVAEIPARSRDMQDIEAFEKLTPRLKEMLRLIAEGLSTKQIAGRLSISKKTVEFHRGRLTRQLGIRAIALLARYAVRVGATSP